MDLATTTRIQDHNAAACGDDHTFIDGAEGEFCFACGLTPQQAAERARGWIAFCGYCDVDRSVVMTEPGTPVCPEHADEHRAWLAAREAAKPARCPECYRPGPPCPEREDGRCRHCHAAASDIILSHYHPYRSTND